MRCLLGEHLNERVATSGIRIAHLAQVPVIAARLDQRRERELLERRRPAVAEPLVLDPRLKQGARTDDPPEP